MNNQDTITAPITAPGQSAVSIVRVSGPICSKVLSELTPKAASQIEGNPGKLTYSSILDLTRKKKAELDNALVVFFKGPESFTGEDVIEFNLHGSSFILDRLIQNLLQLGVRLANPGEFTERAFLNGKLDLSQAEAVADLISAETETQARLAKEQLDGKLSDAISKLGEPLRNLLAEIEANIDFPEEDIEPLTYKEWEERILESGSKVRQYLDSYSSGKLYREGANVVLVGPPNAGKSSLLNSLLGEDRVIVTSIAGTTRDTIEERIPLDGLFLKLWDTAGLETEERTAGEVEKLGIEISWKKAKEADLLLYVFDSSKGINAERERIEKVRKLGRKLLVLGNKVDLISEESGEELSKEEVILVSTKEASSIKVLKEEIKRALVSDDGPRSSVLISTKRHYDSLSLAGAHLDSALVGIKSEIAAELISIELRAALGALEDIVGVTHTEDILGRIFSKFCIGK